MPADGLTARVLAGEPRAIARAISLVEDGSAQAPELIRQLYPHAGRAYIVGITGLPGAGKSTLVDRLTVAMRGAGRTVGILAVDPTSPFTGGALLGDRLRMGGHWADPGVFIRSMASRGRLGGLASATNDAALVLDAAGMETIVIETVGAGQDEVEIVRAADVSVVTLMPGAGDDVQALKAGLMEIGDIFVVNQADRDGADRLVQAIDAMLELQPFQAGAWRPPVLQTQATTDRGVAEVLGALDRFRAQSQDGREARRRVREEHHLRALVAARLLAHTEASLDPGVLERLVDGIVSRTIDPYTAAGEIVTRALRRELAPPEERGTS